jgi:glycosyltransferase involved in cell wall biosynthesis
VATPNPGSREVLGDDYGGLAEDGEFAPALVALLKDESRRRALERSGLRRAAEFSIDRMIDQYEALLSDLRGSHARSVASA